MLECFFCLGIIKRGAKRYLMVGLYAETALTGG